MREGKAPRVVGVQDIQIPHAGPVLEKDSFSETATIALRALFLGMPGGTDKRTWEWRREQSQNPITRLVLLCRQSAYQAFRLSRSKHDFQQSFEECLGRGGSPGTFQIPDR